VPHRMHERVEQTIVVAARTTASKDESEHMAHHCSCGQNDRAGIGAVAHSVGAQRKRGEAAHSSNVIGSCSFSQPLAYVITASDRLPPCRQRR
jgi:hypothetical protein